MCVVLMVRPFKFELRILVAPKCNLTRLSRSQYVRQIFGKSLFGTDLQGLKYATENYWGKVSGLIPGVAHDE